MTTRKLLRLCLFILITFVSACSAGWTRYTSPDLGIQVDVPEDWIINDTSETIILGSDPEMFDTNKIGNGAGVTIAVADSTQFGDPATEPKELLASFMAFYIMQGNAPDIVQEGEPDLYKINGQNAASATYSGSIDGEEGIYTATVISQGEKFVLVLGADGSENNEHANTIEKITKSIVIE